MPSFSCKGKNRDPENTTPGLPGLFQCQMQSQRDSCDGANTPERCAVARDHLWHRGPGILQVTQEDGNLPEILLAQLSSSYLRVLRTNTPTVTLFVSFSLPHSSP